MHRKFEKPKSFLKRILESLIVPLFLSILTLYITNRLERNSKNTDKITLAVEVLNSIKDGDINRTLLCQRIINEVLEGDQYENLNKIINEYIQSEIDKSISSNSVEHIDSMKAIIHNSGSQESKDMLKVSTNKSKNKIDKLREARRLEKEAFKDIVDNDIDSAIIKLKQVEKLHPTLHSVYEIRKELEKNNDINDIKTKIVNKYNWGAPKEELLQIKNQIK